MTQAEIGTSTSAAEMMRALGVTVDGPTQWGNRVPSAKPGVFVVELPGGAEAAPIDIVAVRRWVERVPDILVDREPATAALVARRLESLWLAGEPIIYVGRSTRAIGSRVAAMYATTLGDPRPFSGGHWIKTLSVLRNLRFWWAETNAHEEYQDALLSEIAGRSGGRLPFANLSAGGVTKEHGIANSLLEAPEAVATSTGKRKRTTTKARPPRPTVPRTTVKGAVLRPAPEPTYVSREGLAKMVAELDELRTTTRPLVIARVKTAREFGDLKENGDYEYARKEQSFVEGRIQTLEQLLKSSVVIDESPTIGTARIGSTIVVTTDGGDETYLLVGSAEADPVRGRISNVSPVGRALIGARAGDEITVELPRGTVAYLVKEVR